MSTIKHEVQIRTVDNRGRMLLPRWQSVPAYFDVSNFGAVGDGVTDDTAAINATIAAAMEADDTGGWDLVNFPDDQYGGSVVVTAVGNFLISGTVTIPCNFDGSRATFITTTGVTPVIRVTGLASDVVIQRKQIIFPEIIHKTGAAPDSATGTAIQIVNAQFCRFQTRKIERFDLGLSITPNGDGFAWNNLQLGWFLNCNVGLDIGHGMNSLTSYANENQFFGGAFEISSGSSVANTRYIRIGRCNGLTFYSPALEGDAPEYHVECAGRFNMLFMPRFEGSTSLPRVLFTDVVGTAFSSGCDNAIWMGVISGTGTGGLVVTNSGTYSGRNQVQAWAPGATGGVTHQGSSEYWDSNLSGGTATLAVDQLNHRVGVGTATPHSRLHVVGQENINIGDWSFLGQVGSTLGTVLGYNAKAKESSGTETTEAANTYANGAKYILVTDSGIKLHASNAAVTAADDLSNVGLKVTVDDTGVKLTSTPVFSASAKYLVLGTDGYIRVSATGPGS